MHEIAIWTFKSDKKTNITNTLANNSVAISMKVKNDLIPIIKDAKLLSEKSSDYLASSWSDFVGIHGSTVYVQLFSLKDLKLKSHLLNLSTLYESENPKVLASKIMKDNLSALSQDMEFRVARTEAEGIPVLELFIPHKERNRIVVVGLLISEQFKYFWDFSTRSLAVDAHGSVLIPESEDDRNVVNIRQYPWGKKLMEGQQAAGVFEHLNEDGKGFILSFQKTMNNQLTVITKIRHEEAYAAIARFKKDAKLVILAILIFALFITRLFTIRLAKGFEGVLSATKAIAKGDFEHQIKSVRFGEIGQLNTAVNDMGKNLVILTEEKLKKIAYEKDLDIAQKVQGTFFNHEDETPDYVGISGETKQADHCGGDWWGYYVSKKFNRIYFWIADATGHGTGASLITGTAYGAVRTLLDRAEQGDDPIPPEQIFYHLNNTIGSTHKSQDQFCMTGILGMIDPEKNLLTYVPGGHIRPFFIPRDDQDERLHAARGRKGVGLLTARGNIVGIFMDQDFVPHEFELKAGDKIVLITDGITEAKFGGEINTSKKKRDFGTKRLTEILVNYHSNSSIEELRDIVMERVQEYMGDNKPDDDISIMILEYRGHEAKVLSQDKPEVQSA